MWHNFVLLPLAFFLGIAAAAPPGGSERQSEGAFEALFTSLEQYHIAVYHTGPKWRETSGKELEENLRSHAGDIRRLMKAGTLVGFARVTDSSGIRGVAFFSKLAGKDVRAIVEKGAAVQDSVLTVEVYDIAGTRGIGSVRTKGGEAPTTAYFLTILSKGAAWSDTPGKEDASMIDVHAANVLRLKEEGTLKFYGAVIGLTPVRNISILAGSSAEEVQSKLAAGPLIRKEWFAAEVHPCVIVDGRLP